MANIKSAKKRIKQSEKKRLRNKSIKSEVRTYIKRLEDKFFHKNTEGAFDLFRLISKKLDKAAQKGVFHKNMTARKKSRLNSKLKVLTQKN